VTSQHVWFQVCQSLKAAINGHQGAVEVHQCHSSKVVFHNELPILPEIVLIGSGSMHVNWLQRLLELAIVMTTTVLKAMSGSEEELRKPMVDAVGPDSANLQSWWNALVKSGAFIRPLSSRLEMMMTKRSDIRKTLLPRRALSIL